MKEITRKWLDFAKTDIIAANNSSGDEFITNIVAFHSQQAIEKCFKAIIEENDLQLKRIHSLLKLYGIIKSYINFDINPEYLDILDKVYTTSRYPGSIGFIENGKPSIRQTMEMLDYAQYVFNSTLKMLTPK